MDDRSHAWFHGIPLHDRQMAMFVGLALLAAVIEAIPTGSFAGSATP
jgi:hypothetical protein